MSRTIAEVAGSAERFTDYSVPDAGIRAIFAPTSVWQAWLDVEVALAISEAAVGMIPQDAADRIAAVGFVENLDLDRLNAAFREQAHPVMPLVAELAHVAGDGAGGWVHWGATSQNITHTGNALLVGRAHARVRRLIVRSLDALAVLADRGADMIMAGRTHGQHAVPITFGLKAATWIEDLLGCLVRIDIGAGNCATAMVGGAAGTFASLGSDGPRVQALVAQQLGLQPMLVPSRALLTPQAGYLNDLAVLAAAVARIAVDIESLMQTEFGEASEPIPAGSVGSSTMPHKRNPKLCADILELSGQVRSLAPEAVSATIHSGEADGGATATLDRLTRVAMIAIGDMVVRLAVVLEGLEVSPRRMRVNLDVGGGLIGSEAVMLALGETLGRDRAHHLVYELAMRAATTGESFAELLGDEAEVSAVLDRQRIDDLLDASGHTGLSSLIAREAAARVRALHPPEDTSFRSRGDG